MEQLIEYILIGYLGMIIHVLTKMDEERKTPGFTVGGFMKDHVFHTMLSLLGTPLLIYMCWKDPLVQSYLPLTIPIAIMIGYNSQSVLKFVVNRYKPKKTE